MNNKYLTTAKAIAAVAIAGCIATALPTSGALAGVVGIGQSDSVKLEAPLTNVHWRPYRHHHCCGSPVFTKQVETGVVTYPIYRIDHYKIDYTAPTFTYTEKCCGGWLW